ncbi:MAG: hypothetical protein KAW67_03820 [Candidatus Eisenbacteria sp.]|nr:hypothetical protein [Candidatus Eisenbacteria bacterium]
MIRSMLTVILVLSLAMSASAYDVLYSNDTAATYEASAFGIGGSFLYFMANSGYDKDGESHDWADGIEYTGMWFPIDIHYGILDGFEVGVTPIFMMDKLTFPDPTPEYSGTGIGDTWIWAKYGFLPDPMLTARVGVKLATGNDEPDEEELALGTGQMDIDGALMFGVPAGPGSFDGAIGYRYRLVNSADEESRDIGDCKPGNEIHFFAGYTYFLSDVMNLRIGADGYFGSDEEEDTGEARRDLVAVEETGMSVVYINPGFDYIMDSGMSLGFDMHYPLMGTNEVAAWGFGLSIGWGS